MAYMNATGVYGTMYDFDGNKYITGTLATSISAPGVDTNIPTEKAVIDYLDGIAADLGDIVTTG